MPDREAIARRYGFDTYAELLDASFRLPKTPGEVMQSYVCKHRNGHWFVWQGVPQKPGESDSQPIA